MTIFHNLRERRLCVGRRLLLLVLPVSCFTCLTLGSCTCFSSASVLLPLSLSCLWIIPQHFAVTLLSDSSVTSLVRVGIRGETVHQFKAGTDGYWFLQCVVCCVASKSHRKMKSQKERGFCLIFSSPSFIPGSHPILCSSFYEHDSCSFDFVCRPEPAGSPVTASDRKAGSKLCRVSDRRREENRSIREASLLFPYVYFGIILLIRLTLCIYLIPFLLSSRYPTILLYFPPTEKERGWSEWHTSHTILLGINCFVWALFWSENANKTWREIESQWWTRDHLCHQL